MSAVFTEMLTMKDRHAKTAQRAREEQVRLSNRAELPILLARLMAEHAAALKEVVDEYERCAVALGFSHEQFVGLLEQRANARLKLVAVSKLLSVGKRKDALRLVNDLVISLGGAE